MTEESKKILLPLGDVSLAENLGVYYIDMRPAIIHYENNIYGGAYDDDGIPMNLSEGKLFYYPINIAQYGFIIHARYLSSQDGNDLQLLKRIAGKLLDLATINEKHCYWEHNSERPRFQLKPGWTSSMAQGECISFFLRYYQLTQESIYLEASKKAFQFMVDVPVEEGGVRAFDKEENLWLEEYPTPAPNGPSCVLNGFIYALFGLYDLYRVTKDEVVQQEINACIATLKNTLPKFDTGYWSLYDLYTKELVRYYYQKNVHVPLLDVLYQLTNEPIFLKYKKKWQRTVNPFNYTFVKIMYRVLPRWRKMSWKL